MNLFRPCLSHTPGLFFLSFSSATTLRIYRTAAVATASCLPEAASFDRPGTPSPPFPPPRHLSEPFVAKQNGLSARSADEMPINMRNDRCCGTKKICPRLVVPRRGRTDLGQSPIRAAHGDTRERGGKKRRKCFIESPIRGVETVAARACARTTRKIKFDKKTRRRRRGRRGGHDRSVGRRPRPKRPLGTESTG